MRPPTVVASLLAPLRGSTALRALGAMGFIVMLLAFQPAALAQDDRDDSQREDVDPRVRSMDTDVARGRVDLNRATMDEILSLPITKELAEAIWEYRTYVGYFESFYDLNEIEGMTPAIMAQLAPLVAVIPPPAQDEDVRRYDLAFRQIQRFLSQEGASEGLTDEYFDMLVVPRDINDLNLYELMTYQNVSPVDAVAILKARERSGEIQSQRQLRSVDGLNYWGYRNLRDYVVYQPRNEGKRVRGWLQLSAYDTPYMLDDRDLLLEPIPQAPVLGQGHDDFDIDTPWGIRGLDSPNPAVYAKLRLRLGENWKAGLMTWRNVGEEHLDETVKGFLEWKNPRRRRFKIDKIVLGNYRLAFGQGLVMDNTDFWLARKTGYGFNKRPMNLIGDVSRTYEFALRGAAIEATASNFHGTFWYSHDSKDGIVNFDSEGNPVSINRYSLMQPRFEEAELDTIGFGMRRDAFDETMVGGNLKYQFLPGTYVGVTAYEAKYTVDGIPDSLVFFDPDIRTLVADLDVVDPRDAEIIDGYDSSQIGNFRRVYGAEFQTVFENVAFQGEYAKLDANPTGGLFDPAPEAWVLNGYVQYENLQVLALYRDYDVGFDNPYHRGFGNDRRYEQTILGDPFRLQTPLFTALERYNPQTKAEKGFFIGTRYRISRQLTITGFEYDQWTRVADGQDLSRWTFRAEYAPVWPLRFRIRQRFSSRAEDDLSDFRGFKSWDTRLEMRARLTDWDELRLMYVTGSTQFRPRPRLSGSAEPNPPDSDPDNPLAEAGSPNHAVQGQLIHNVNAGLQIVLSSTLFQGFLWNFEDNEFVVVDGQGIRNWFLIRSRINDHLVLRFKFTTDHRRVRNNVQIREFNEIPDPATLSGPAVGQNVRPMRTAFRLQLDYTF